MKRVAIVVGTRPEAIKLASVTSALRESAELDVRVLATAQHRDLLDQALAEMGLVADVDLDLMTPAQNLSNFAGRCLGALGDIFAAEAPDYVIGQGDTTTALAAAQAAHHARIPFGHVEAGLRSGRRDTPFPEEMNRRLISLLADHHFCPTPAARANLLREGVSVEAIYVTGNTIIDTLRNVVPRCTVAKRAAPSILVTVHRSENVAALPTIVGAVYALLDLYPTLRVRWPIHPNPRLGGAIRDALDAHPRVDLTDSLSHGAFVEAMRDARLILTDSGGVQEEAPALGTPVLVLRTETERPEGIAAGVARLVGTDPRTILPAAIELIEDDAAHRRMANGASPYGDGQAGARIAAVVRAYLADRPARFDPAGPVLQDWGGVTAG
ncbi:UDP-N-acetylglucosamine 2-epimerase (non-hydrolyzing) [Sphingomonas sp. BIUV-7]|uniref:UDP-N-acetylglucosamine 2-epimerase (non-hydrolyzing) n=1 Tax=Sphingomonas natans TaxID=3063330 RepID=A0ABT8Y9Y0_9SPHN|nr:UDP-N-acetylglucosamine 2-epimerase (non-hydrolyzing) [Sphingomonas sp. BIUV-7]MDO6414792.1 UDP-N-acetylglucosamine 2-epimerase (non-hydrolyzing) [Sphingomonas sp. BIUV-7]